jgi:flagellin
VGDNLQRMRELAVQSANASNSLSDRTNLDAEYKQLSAEVTRVLTGTKFNGVDLLNTAATLTFQVGANDILTDKVDVLTTDLAAGAGVTAALAGDVLSSGAALTAMTNLDTAIGEITTGRATFGAAQNRFDAIVSNLQVAVENQTASRSRIMDADFAVETANMTRASILQQAGTAMLAQANALPNTVLTLLRG